MTDSTAKEPQRRGGWKHGPAKGAGRGGPAKGAGRGSARAPAFGQGNDAAKRHGARSAKVYQPLARELAAGLLADRPDLASYPEAVASWSEAEARAALLRAWLAERDILDDDGLVERTSGPLKWLSALEKQAREGRRDLGLDPRSDAELAKARAEATRHVADLDAIRAAGRQALTERELVEVLGSERDQAPAHEEHDGG